jgi:Zn-dependent M16 (insulinase) family peptidase
MAATRSVATACSACTRTAIRTSRAHWTHFGEYQLMQFSLTHCTHNSGAIDWALKGSFRDDDVHEALLSVMSSLDAPVAPSHRGSWQFNTGITDDERLAFRKRLLSITRDDLVDVCARVVAPQLRDGRASTAVLGNASHAQALQSDAHWHVTTFAHSS